jgi:polysaccharide export outer membrane protein
MNSKNTKRWVSSLWLTLSLAASAASAASAAVAEAPVEQWSPAPSDPYHIQPGDVLSVSVWKEPELQGEVLVRPDGGLTLPLVGEIGANRMTLERLRQEITQRLQKYVPDPVVTVALKQLGGNRIYVLGKVNRPGEFTFSKPLDVMQAIALAGGTNAFASVNSIVILRRKAGGNQDAIPFHYAEVEKGQGLEQNILLTSGDTVVVP